FIVALSFFFFQAEDGIRDFHVTGVQTCALPIYSTHLKSIVITLITKIAIISMMLRTRKNFPIPGRIRGCAGEIADLSTNTTETIPKIQQGSIHQKMNA